MVVRILGRRGSETVRVFDTVETIKLSSVWMFYEKIDLSRSEVLVLNLKYVEFREVDVYSARSGSVQRVFPIYTEYGRDRIPVVSFDS